MSGLNDDIEPDIENELPGQNKLAITPDQFKTVDASVAKPGEDQPIAPSIILKVGEDQLDDEGKSITPSITDLFGQDVVPNQLPDINAKIVLMENSRNTIVDATSALDNIKVNRTISQEDINEINAIFPTYLNDGERIEYYTKTPTLTRYTTAVNTIGFKIADQAKEQLALSIDTFDSLKESIVKTQAYIKQTLVDTTDARQKHLSVMLEFIKEHMNERDISGYHAVIVKMLSNTLEFDVTHSDHKVTNLMQSALDIVRKPTAFATLLNKQLFLAEEIDQDFVFSTLSSPNNLAERSVKATLKELIEYTFSEHKLRVVSLLDDILAAGTNYVDNCIFAIKNNDASDIGKEPEPLEILKRESKAIIDVNTLALSMVEFDKIMLDITTEFASIIKSIP